jgi:hypothetical protein
MNNSLPLKKITLIIIVIASAIIVGFGVWTITPYFTNTTIDEPLPTSLVLHNVIETETVIKTITNVLDI